MARPDITTARVQIGPAGLGTFAAVLLIAVVMLLAPGAVTPAAALEQPDTLDLDTMDMVPVNMWGVSGQNPQNTQTETLDVLVYDFAQSGNYMFVGGAFLNVQEGKRTTPIKQSYVAAFDIYTGEWISTWTPTIDRAVYALDVLPNGSLLVGGEFERVNGTSRRGLVALDPITGQIDTSFSGAVDRPWSSRRATVRDMKVETESGLIYVAGSFSHLEGINGSRTQVGKVGRFSTATGVIDATWKPLVSGGSVWGIDTDRSRGVVALSGFFTSVNAQASSGHFEVVNDHDGKLAPGRLELRRNHSRSQPEIWDVVYGNGLVFTIGEQHILQVLDADDHRQLGYFHTGVTNDGFAYGGGFAGGSYQAGERIGDIVFAGCHCTSGTNNLYDSFTGRRTTRKNVQAFDARTGRHIEKFNADIESPRDGFWAAASSTNGCLYLGGDFHVGGTQAGRERWLGGFAKLCSPNPAHSMTAPGPQGAILQRRVSMQIEASGRPDLTLRYAATGLPDGLGINTETGLITGTPTKLGGFTTKVTVTDVDGVGLPASATFSWRVMDSDPPVLSPVSRTVVLNSNQMSIQLVANDTEMAPFTWTATGLPDGTDLGPDGRITGRPEAGQYTITATVTDAAGLSDTVAFDLVVVESGSQPAISSFSGYSSGGGSYIMGWQFTVDARTTISDLGAHDTNRNGKLDNGAATAVGLWDSETGQLLGSVSIPASASIDDGFAYGKLATAVTAVPGKTYIVAGQIAGESYAYNGSIEVSDGINFVGAAYRTGSTLNMPDNTRNGSVGYIGATFRSGSDPTPTVTSPGAQLSSLNTPVTLDMQAAGAEGLVLTFSATGLPSGLSIDSATGRISGTPDTLEETTTTVTVTDEIGLTASQSFVWSILDANPPAVVAIADETIAQTDSVSIQVQATDDANDTLTFTATGLPNGLTIGRTTGLIAGAPSTAGTHQITVAVSDRLGLTAERTFTLTVLAWPSAPAVAAVSGPVSSGAYFIGWKFTVDRQMTIADLGIHDANGDGKTSSASTAALYDNDTQQLLGQVTIPANTQAVDGVIYAALDQPVTVQPGKTYAIAADVSNEGFIYNATFTLGDGVNHAGYAYKSGAAAGWPSRQNNERAGNYFGGSFLTRGQRPDLPDAPNDNGGDGGVDNGGGDAGGGQQTTLLTAGSQWRYEDSGADLGSSWRQPSFDDAAWPAGAAEFGFGEGDETSAWTPGSVTYYARTDFEFSGTKPASLDLELKADDGAVVYLNGVEVLRDNMPNGPIGYQTTAVRWRSGVDEAFASFTVSAEQLLEGTNVVAVEVHNVWGANPDLSFDLAISASDAADEIVRGDLIAHSSDWSYSDSSNGEPENWKTGLNGAPSGTAEFGFGDDDETTVLTSGHDAYYFTRTFNAADVVDIADLTLGVAADDGAVVYLNGIEIQRINMPDGQIDFDTRPLTWVAGVDEKFTEYTVSSDALREGSNVIAVEVHNLWPGNNDLSFDLYLK